MCVDLFDMEPLLPQGSVMCGGLFAFETLLPQGFWCVLVYLLLNPCCHKFCGVC